MDFGKRRINMLDKADKYIEKHFYKFAFAMIIIFILENL